MTPESTAARLAVHEQRLDSIEERQNHQDATDVRILDKLDEVKSWIMGSLAGVVITLLGVFFSLFFKS